NRFGSLGNSEQTKPSGEFAFIHHSVADQIWIFNVMDDRSVEVAGVGQGPAHDLCVSDALGAVCKCDGSGRLEEADLRHFLSFETFGDRGHGMNMDDAGIACAPKDV